MARGRLTFRKHDVKRAVEAARAAGIEVSRVEIDKNGKIVIVGGKPGDAAEATTNEWDAIYDQNPTPVRK